MDALQQLVEVDLAKLPFMVALQEVQERDINITFVINLSCWNV